MTVASNDSGEGHGARTNRPSGILAVRACCVSSAQAPPDSLANDSAVTSTPISALAIEMALVGCAAGDHANRMARVKAPVPTEDITRAILVLRGHRVLRDSELASLYGVTTKRLNEQVKRNAGRFPVDFIFRLTRTEIRALNRSRFATGPQKHRDPRFPLTPSPSMVPSWLQWSSTARVPSR